MSQRSSPEGYVQSNLAEKVVSENLKRIQIAHAGGHVEHLPQALHSTSNSICMF